MTVVVYLRVGSNVVARGFIPGLRGVEAPPERREGV